MQEDGVLNKQAGVTTDSSARCVFNRHREGFDLVVCPDSWQEISSIKLEWCPRSGDNWSVNIAKAHYIRILS